MLRAMPFVVVAAVDGSELTTTVLERALDAATRRPNHAIHVVRVIEEKLDPIFAIHRSSELEALRQELDEDVADVLGTRPGPDSPERSWRIHTHVAAGVPTEEVACLAADVDAHLIVVGRHVGLARRDSFVGPAPERLLRLAHCPVLVVQRFGAEPEDEPECAEWTWGGGAA